MIFQNAETKERFQTVYKAVNLNLLKHRVVSFVGAGGKTTLLYALAHELAELGNRVVVTTTTHMERPTTHFCEWSGEIEINRGEVCTIGRSCEGGKIVGIPHIRYNMLLEYADYVLIEADGSRKMPLKVPAEHEPVLVEETDFVIGVLGFSSVGKKIADVSHRAADVAAFLHKEEHQAVTSEDLAKISFSPQGLLKGVRCPYQIVWNRWNGQETQVRDVCPVLFCMEEKFFSTGSLKYDKIRT